MMQASKKLAMSIPYFGDQMSPQVGFATASVLDESA
jgi:hypothetical protein